MGVVLHKEPWSKRQYAGRTTREGNATPIVIQQHPADRQILRAIADHSITSIVRTRARNSKQRHEMTENKRRDELTMDIFTPTSTYPDTCPTPGVVSHTPEFFTTLKLELNPAMSSSLRVRDGGRRLRREETNSRLEGSRMVALVECDRVVKKKRKTRDAMDLKEHILAEGEDTGKVEETTEDGRE